MKRRLVTTYGDDDRSGVQEDVFFFDIWLGLGHLYRRPLENFTRLKSAYSDLIHNMFTRPV